jgi:hypothetical protein
MRANLSSWAACVSGALTEHQYLAAIRQAGFVNVEKIAGGENLLEPVYSAKIVAHKPS